MKQIKKGIFFSVTALILSLVFATYAQASTPSAPATLTICNFSSVAPKAAIIDWRYKSVDGKIYRRLYNYTYQRWEGDWELCP